MPKIYEDGIRQDVLSRPAGVTDAEVAFLDGVTSAIQTQIDNAGGLWTVLGDYEATVAEASHNFNFTAVDFDDDSELVLVMDISVTAALALLLRINSITTTNYFCDGRRIQAGWDIERQNWSTGLPRPLNQFLCGSSRSRLQTVTNQSIQN